MLEQTGEIPGHGRSRALLHQPVGLPTAQHADHDALDEQRLLLEVHLDRLEVAVLRHEPNDGAFLTIALHGDLVLQARHDDLAAAHLRRAVNRDEVAIENAGILHAHAGDLEKVMRPRLKKARIDLQAGFEILFREDRLAGGDPADERQTHLLADGVLQLNATRGSRHERDDTLAGERAQMVLGRIGRPESELAGDLRPGGRHAGIADGALDQAQNLHLARGKVGHFALPVHLYTTAIIYRSRPKASGSYATATSMPI